MDAYLQTSESGFEEELEVSFPDPQVEGGKDIVIVLPFEHIVEAFSSLPINSDGQVWVRVVFPTLPKDAEAAFDLPVETIVMNATPPEKRV